MQLKRHKKNQEKVTHKVQRTVHVTNLPRKHSGVIYILSPPPLCVVAEEQNSTEFNFSGFSLPCQGHPPCQLQHIHIKLQSCIQFFTLVRVYQRAFIFLKHFASSGQSVPFSQLHSILPPTGCEDQHLRGTWRWD